MYTGQEVTMLLSFLACTDGVVTSAETFDWYTDEIRCTDGENGHAYWTAPDPRPMLAVSRASSDDGAAAYWTVQVDAASGEAIISCNANTDTVTVTYAVRADTE